jgi:hypothetical protein
MHNVGLHACILLFMQIVACKTTSFSPVFSVIRNRNAVCSSFAAVVR